MGCAEDQNLNDDCSEEYISGQQQWVFGTSHCVLPVSNVRQRKVKDVCCRNAMLQGCTVSSHVSSYSSPLQNPLLPSLPISWQRVTGDNCTHHVLPSAVVEQLESKA